MPSLTELYYGAGHYRSVIDSIQSQLGMSDMMMTLSSDDVLFLKHEYAKRHHSVVIAHIEGLHDAPLIHPKQYVNTLLDVRPDLFEL